MDTAKTESKFPRRRFLVALHVGAVLAGLGGAAAFAFAKRGTKTAMAEHLEQKVEDGDNESKFILAFECYKGQRVPRDLPKAYGLFIELARQGDSAAMRMVGRMLVRGEGVAADPTAGAIWSRRAADLGDEIAMFDLGVQHDGGAGVPKDPVQSAAWYARSAELGYVPAMLVHADRRLAAGDAGEACAWLRATELMAAKSLDWKVAQPMAAKARASAASRLDPLEREKVEAQGVLLCQRIQAAKDTKFKADLVKRYGKLTEE